MSETSCLCFMSPSGNHPRNLALAWEFTRKSDPCFEDHIIIFLKIITLVENEFSLVLHPVDNVYVVMQKDQSQFSF